MKKNAGDSEILVLNVAFKIMSAIFLILIFGCQGEFEASHQRSTSVHAESAAGQLEFIDQSIQVEVDCVQVNNMEEQCDLNGLGPIEKANRILERIKKYIKSLWKITDILSILLTDEASKRLADQLEKIENKFVELMESVIVILDPTHPDQLKLRQDLEDLVEFVHVEITRMIEELQ